MVIIVVEAKAKCTKAHSFKLCSKPIKKKKLAANYTHFKGLNPFDPINLRLKFIQASVNFTEKPLFENLFKTNEFRLP